jgi:hypothetical protein
VFCRWPCAGCAGEPEGQEELTGRKARDREFQASPYQGRVYSDMAATSHPPLQLHTELAGRRCRMTMPRKIYSRRVVSGIEWPGG